VSETVSGTTSMRAVLPAWRLNASRAQLALRSR
jgi:hypothetical protein